VSLFCAVTGIKNPYDRPKPPHFPKNDHAA
jgi:hypothetical protein